LSDKPTYEHHERFVILFTFGLIHSYGKHISIRLGPKETYQGIVVPKGFAHGYLTLEANSTLLYFMDNPYVPESAKGIVWNDPILRIAWPYEPEVMSGRDKEFPPMKSL
jgi:dTDP-4-dehydrorhamnose 3,5-epimerase